MTTELNDQPRPEASAKSEPVEPVLVQLIRERTRVGLERYGQALHTHNGRDALVDALQEALDLCQYLTQEVMERRTGLGVGEPFTVDTAADGLALLAWADRVIRAGGYRVEGWDPDRVRVVPAVCEPARPDAEAWAEAAGASCAAPANDEDSGQVCTACGSARMQRTGTCSACLDCGESGGCS